MFIWIILFIPSIAGKAYDILFYRTSSDLVKKSHKNKCIAFSKLYRFETEAISHQCKKNALEGLMQYRPEREVI